MKGRPRVSSVSDESRTRRISDVSGIEDNKRTRPSSVGPPQITIHADRKSSLSADNRDDKRRTSTDMRRARPVSVNTVQTAMHVNSGRSTPDKSRVQQVGNRSKRTRPATHNSAQTKGHLGLGETESHAVSETNDSYPTNKHKASIAWCPTQASPRRQSLSRAEDRMERQPKKGVLGELLEDMDEEDIRELEEVEVIGALREIRDQDSEAYDVITLSTPEPHLSCCDSLEEQRNDQMAFNAEEASSDDDDSQYDTDLEEDFPKKTYNRSPTGKDIYEFECEKKGIIPASFILTRLTCPEVLMPHHGLGPEGGKALAKALVVNTFIETLDLSDNDLRATGGTAMAYVLYENFYITDLDLSDNTLDTAAGVAIAKAMVSNKTVRRLILRGNRFNDKVAMSFAETLQENSRLSVLDLSYNHLGETGGLYLGAGLSLNYGLTMLNLRWNAICGKGAISIAHALSTNETLKSLDLAWNSFGYKGAMALSMNLLSNENLKHLDLRNNHFNESAVLKLVPAFAQHKSLVEIKIGQNPIGNEAVNAVFDAVISNPRIRHVGLEDISVPVKFLSVIKELEDERDAVIITDKRTRLSTTEPEKEGMDILIDFLNDNSLRLKDMFFRLDKDRSGDISREEFKLGLKEMGILMDSRQLDKLIKEIDKDGNDKIDYSEILGGHRSARMQKRRQTMVRSEMKKMEQAALLLPEMDIIKSSLSLKRL